MICFGRPFYWELPPPSLFTDIVTEFENFFESKLNQGFCEETREETAKNNRFVTGIMIVKIFMYNIFVIMLNVE